MPAGFVAGAFAAVDDDGLLIVTLGAPSIEDEDFYLMLQHQDEYDEQDVELGMDQPYIEYCGQGWSWYGHIVSFDLHRDHVRVQMDAQAAREMDNDGLLEVHFDLADAQFHALRLALRFAEEQAPQLAEQVYLCFERAGAYGRFKSLLERYGRLQGWYDFEAAATEQALREWAADNGITPVERPL